MPGNRLKGGIHTLLVTCIPCPVCQIHCPPRETPAILWIYQIRFFPQCAHYCPKPGRFPTVLLIWHSLSSAAAVAQTIHGEPGGKTLEHGPRPAQESDPVFPRSGQTQSSDAFTDDCRAVPRVVGSCQSGLARGPSTCSKRGHDTRQRWV